MTVTDHAILRDGTLLATDELGNVGPEGDPALGLYCADTRLLSEWRLRVRSKASDASAASAADTTTLFVAAQHVSVSSRRVALVPVAPRNTSDVLLVDRTQSVDGRGLTETVEVRNVSGAAIRIRITVDAGVDFADQFAVRSDGRRFDRSAARRDCEAVPGGLRHSYVHRVADACFEATCVIRGDPPPLVEPRGAGHELRWEMTVPPHDSVTIDLSVGPEPARPAERRVPTVTAAATMLTPEPAELDQLLQRSLADLDALMIDPPAAWATDAPVDPSTRVPAAGAPWFLTLFGRDALLTAILAQPQRPDLGPAVLRALAATQGRVDDPRSLEQPGRIVHELRRSELAVLGLVPYGRYFGSVDVTPLFLVLLGRVALGPSAQFQGAALAAELRPNALAALDWIRGPGGLSETGFLRYRPDPAGLLNQGWKDSADSTVYADGTIASGPIALCEVQGYVYAALVAMAGVATAVWHDDALAARLHAEAAALQASFLQRFWLPDAAFPALALDGADHPVDALGSNAGHLLWSGILQREHTQAVADRLLTPAFLSGWGIRTLAAGQRPYSPLSYHNGSVWPHDTMLTALGMAERGLRAQSRRLAAAVASCGVRLGGRLPEVIGGFSRDEFPEPVRYRLAGSPQAWAAAAGIAAVDLLRDRDREG